jgi:pimeloyl-ACP methyl ester carboxylesterase
MSRGATTPEQFERAQDAAFVESGVIPTSRFVDVRKPPLRVHVLEAGAGDPVLMVHGGNSVAASWAPLLPALAQRFRLLMPDRPGCGLTTPFDYRGVDLRAHGAEFLRASLDALDCERVALLGNSMGGFFAMAFALQYPERVSKLVLLGEPAGADGHPRLYHRLVGTRWLNTLLYATALYPPKDAEAARAGLAKGRLVADPGHLSANLLACFASGAQLPGAVLSWTTMVEQAFAPAGMGLVARRMTVTHSLLPELHKLSAPTLFLWGDRDPFGSPDAGRALADKMPNARLEVITDASHLVWLDQPDACAAGITAFLACDERIRGDALRS